MRAQLVGLSGPPAASPGMPRWSLSGPRACRARGDSSLLLGLMWESDQAWLPWEVRLGGAMDRAGTWGVEVASVSVRESKSYGRNFSC